MHYLLSIDHTKCLKICYINNSKQIFENLGKKKLLYRYCVDVFRIMKQEANVMLTYSLES